MKRRKENLRGRSGADSKQSGGKFAKLGLRWGMFADLAQKKMLKRALLRQFWRARERTFEEAEAKVRPEVRQGIALGGRLWAKLGQEGVKRAKLEPRWRQVGAKSGQRERRGGLRSDLGTKSRILKLVVFQRKTLFLGYRVG